jgi:hypothetical protein
MSKHTPAPLECRDSPGAGLELFGTLPEGFRLENTSNPWGLQEPVKVMLWAARWVQFPTKEWDEMQLANGQLFAAAPDLLDACKRLIECGGGGSDHAEMVWDAAVAQAELAIRAATTA